MLLTWAQPWWLLALPLLAAALAWQLWRHRRRSLRWRSVCLLLPLLAAAALFTVLAGPAWHSSPRSREVVVLLDLSPSARQSPWQSPAQLREFLSQHVPARCTIVGFADSPRLLLRNVALDDPSAWPLRWPAQPGESSNVAAALQWREGDDDCRPRWLITDGLLDLSVLPLRPRPEFALTLAAPKPADVGIADLRLIFPPAGAAHGPDIEARITATAAASFIVRFARAGQEIAVSEIALDAPDGKPVSRIVAITDPAPLPEQPTLYEVQLLPRRGNTLDPWPESDHASILSPRRGPPSILLVSRNAATLRALPAGALTRVSPEEFPDSLDVLSRQQIVILENVPADALRAGAPQLLDRFVRDIGGSLLILGNRDSFGPGNYPGSDLETLSPIASSPPDRPPQHIIFVLDASGSMGEPVGPLAERKFKFVVEGVHNALAFLRDTDDITALTFGDAVRTLARGKKADVAKLLTAALREIQTSRDRVPNGPTHPDGALDDFAADLVNDSQVILLTDGEIQKLDVPRWSKTLAAARAKLTIVAPPSAGPLLTDLAKQTSATWLATDAPERWPALLRQAVELPLIGKAQDAAADWESAGPPPLRGRTTRWIQTWLKPEAQLRATSPAVDEKSGRPLAAIARRGLGQVAAVSFADPGADYAALVASLLKETSPAAGDQRFAIAARHEGDAWVLTVQGHDEKSFFDRESIAAEIIIPGSREPQKIALTLAGPGAYEARVTGAGQGFSAVITRATPEGPALVGRISPAAVPSSEWPATASTTRLPPDFAGERIALGEPMPTQWHPRDAGTRHDLRPALLLTAAGLVLAAMWLRRGGG